jgi:hypothetical protein
MNLKSIALGFMTISLSTVLVHANDGPQAELHGIKCLVIQSGDSPAVLVCLIDDNPDPVITVPEPDTDPDRARASALLVPGSAFTEDSQLWLTAQPSETPQTQPHTP